jgi:hypothetical protein
MMDLCDPKRVGVIFNVCLLKILTSTTVIIEHISWLINVTDNNDARWKPEIKPAILNAITNFLYE